MVIDLTKTPKYHAAAEEMAAKIAAGASVEEQEKLFASAFKALGDELNSMAAEELQAMFDVRAKNAHVTAEEMEFLNSIEKNVGTKNPILIPETTIEEVFDDLKVSHPLLSLINFKTTSVRLKAITAETSGTAVWGEIFGEIKGQLDHVFKEKDFSQNKLTAFVVVPKDALRFGYKWLKTFITEQLKEAIAVALELALVTGTGDKQPVGLMKDLSKPSVSGEVVTYPTNKTDGADLSDVTPENAPGKFAPIMTTLSMSEKKKPVKIDGQVVLLLNPADRWKLEARFTSLNASGTYVTVLPFGVRLMESLAVPAGKAIAFVADRYDAFMSTASEIEEFDQTFALEDLQLYTTKSYYYGKAKDNNVSVVVNVAGI